MSFNSRLRWRAGATVSWRWQLVGVCVALMVGVLAAGWLDREGWIAPGGAVPTPAAFEDGDTVVFVGDSITQNGRYLSYLQAFYLTRFPERRIRFINAGIAGDTAAGARRRLAWDVIPHQPSVVSLLFGMNDVQRSLYAPDRSGAELGEARANALAEYRWNMDVLATQLADRTRARLIFATPTPYDDGARFEAVNFNGVDQALARAGLSLRRLARKHDGALIDLHTPMSQLNRRIQSATPEFSLVGADRIHPGAPGHLLMAYLYLKAQHVPSLVSEFAVDGETGAVLRVLNGRVISVERRPGLLAFEGLEAALPFPIDEAALAAAVWGPIQAELNRQMLVVSFASEARYRLRIDGETVGDFTTAELRGGVNLGLIPHTPQMRQAQRLLAEIEFCRVQELQLRRVAQVRALLEDAKIDPADDGAVDEFISMRLARGGDEAAYQRTMFAEFVARRLTIEADRKGLALRQEKLWELNRPVPRRYELAQILP